MNTEQDNPVPELKSAAVKAISVGSALREARDKLGLSINDVANRIKFAPRQIEALEADDYTSLPEAAFVRGFVRSYARLLALDPTHLLTALPVSHMQPSSSKEIKSVEIPMPSPLSARRYNIILLAAGLLIALTVAIFERMHNRSPDKPVTVSKIKVEELQLPVVAADEVKQVATEESDAEANEAPKEAAKTEQPKIVRSSQVVGPMPKEAANVPKVQAVENRKTLANSTATVQKPPRTNPVAVETATTSNIDGQAGGNVATPGMEHSLRLELDEDAWLEVKDGTDKILVSKMHSAGSLVRMTGKAPLLVIIGNAKSVRLFDNGKKVNLERYTTAEVARVKIK